MTTTSSLATYERGDPDDPSDTVRMGELAGLVYVPTPCPHCGARDMDEANGMCRPSSDETGEVFCSGEFDRDGISVQPTAQSLAEMDAWIDGQVRAVEEEEAKSAARAALDNTTGRP